MSCQWSQPKLECACCGELQEVSPRPGRTTVALGLRACRGRLLDLAYVDDDWLDAAAPVAALGPAPGDRVGYREQVLLGGSAVLISESARGSLPWRRPGSAGSVVTGRRYCPRGRWVPPVQAEDRRRRGPAPVQKKAGERPWWAVPRLESLALSAGESIPPRDRCLTFVSRTAGHRHLCAPCGRSSPGLLR